MGMGPEGGVIVRELNIFMNNHSTETKINTLKSIYNIKLLNRDIFV